MKKISLLILVLICTNVLSQGFPDNPTQIKEIPPSPTMWEFEKYGNYPVSMHTGVPNISIPITSVQLGILQIPVSLNYHASGIKVDEKASWVGLGWSLKVGGAIIRTIRGTQDEGLKGYINYTYYTQGTFDPASSNNYYEMEEMIQGFVDTEPDIFSYDFLGYSGKFIFNPDGTIVSIPHNDLTITPSYIGNNFSSFTIITPEGIIAEFAYPETSSEYRKAGLIGDLTVTANSVWHLKKLTAPNGIDEITFEYKVLSSYTDYRVSESESINYPDPCNTNNYVVSSSSFEPSVFYTNVKRIKKINFRNGYILFNSSAGNRDDDPNDKDLRLDDIKVYSSLNGIDELLKSYELEYDYFGTLNQSHPKPEYTVRLELQKIYEAGSNGTRKNPYEFFYKDSGLDILPPRFSYSQDYWGYYNGKANSSLVPEYQHQMINGGNIVLGDADRNVDASRTVAGILEKIEYPTLGYTIFEFEGNTATIMDGPTPVQYVSGGLRVKSISNYEENGIIQWQKSYEYTQKDNPTLSSGVYNGNNYISPGDFFYGSSYYYSVNWGEGCIQNVLEYNTYNEGVSSSPAIANNFASVFYASVKEYNGSPTTHEGFKWYHYETTKDDFVQGMGPISFSIDHSWDRGQLLLEESYENGNSNPVTTVTNVYEEVQAQASISGFKPGTRYSVASLGYVPASQDPYTFRYQQYFLTYYNEPISWKRLKTTTTVQDGIITVKNFFYDGSLKHTNVIKSSLISSLGETLETKTYYPDDITSNAYMTEGGNLTTQEYTQIDRLKKDDLHQRNIPIQTVTKKNTQILSIQRNLFDTTEGIVMPSSIKTAKGNVNVKERVLYSNYKNGKLVEVSKKEGPTTVYIWGYNNQYPIAKIENSTYSAIESLTEFGTNFTITDSLNTAQESALRDLPNTLVTTYTYDPLVGVTSISDSKGRTVTYHYDEFNRLEFVKDHEGKVISKNQYHYKSQ